MLWQLCEYVLEVVVGAQVVQFCGFRDAVHQRTCIGAVGRVMEHPVLFAQAESPDGTLACLSIYENKYPYTQDIFILIFSEIALKNSSLAVKDEDNIFT